MAYDVRLLTMPFDPGAEIDRFAAAQPGAGGIASFVGKVRSGGGVEALELSHYGPLTLPGMEALADEAAARWSVMGLLVVHRTGLLHPGEPIVAVSAAARHRRDALIAVDFIMDHLKGKSWFWKREKSGGSWHWIEPREADFADLDRWR
jgi:molybdopterin synthase catalytic subunit